MSNPWLHAFASVVLLLAMTAPASAAEPVTQSHPCAIVVDPADRLVCYDAAFPPGAETKSDAEARKLKAVRDFGLKKTQLHSREPERLRGSAPDRVEAAVVRVINRATGERMVTLDNGQVWLLPEVTLKGHLRSGDRVAIRGAALGTYMLVTPTRVSLRARRIQ